MGLFVIIHGFHLLYKGPKATSVLFSRMLNSQGAQFPVSQGNHEVWSQADLGLDPGTTFKY